MSVYLPAIDPITWFTKWQRWTDLPVSFTSANPFMWEWKYPNGDVAAYAFVLATIDTGDLYPIAAPDMTYPINSMGNRNFYIGEPGNFLPAVLPREDLQRSFGITRLLIYFASEGPGVIPVAPGTYTFSCSGQISLGRKPRIYSTTGYWLNIWRNFPHLIPGIDIFDYSGSTLEASISDEGVLSFNLNVSMRTETSGVDANTIPDGTYFAIDMTF